jgi:hypothetical protein
METKDQGLKNYRLTISTILLSLRIKSILAQTPSLEFNVHYCRPGDYVLIKIWKEEKFQQTWERPYQLLLTTETAVHTVKKGRLTTSGLSL